MLPTKAERILSRYRPIAPKPVPVLASGSFNGTADPSSTCASLDSFTSSSAKFKRSRKRRTEVSSASGKGRKAANPIGSGVTNNGGASSVTQGLSDGTVPLQDRQVAAQISHSGRAFGMEGGLEMPNGTARDTRPLSEVTFTGYGSAQLYVAEGSTMIPHQAASMAELANTQHHLPPLHHRSGAVPFQKDLGFMERAAVAPYVGGGFTEMIRGITRLPSAADVQSLMQVKPCQSSVIGQAAPCASSIGTRGSPVQLKKPEHDPLPPPLPQDGMTKSPSHDHLNEACQQNGELVTLSLLPPATLRMCTASEATAMTALSSAQPPGQESTHGLCTYETSRGCETPGALPSCYASYVQTGAVAESEISATTILKRTTAGGPFVGAVPGVPLTVGAVIDKVYLEQVYGGSTDPVLLVNDCNQVLWFNKPYDRALKSASERILGKVAPTGPYIDPLGHPTPLGSFVLPVYGKPSKARNATLWGFLKKLVVQEHQRPPLERCPSGSSSHLCLGVGESCQRSPPPCVQSAGRVGEARCVEHSRPATVTLESVTELHMEAPTTAESVEAAEARLEAGTEPAMITDCVNTVIWANAALKQMVGHTIVKSLSKHAGPPGEGPLDGRAYDTPAFIMCCAERVPHSAWAFSGRVNIEWMKGSKRRSMMVPCDVSRLATSSRSSDVSWAWKFDMALSLCLNSPY